MISARRLLLAGAAMAFAAADGAGGARADALASLRWQYRPLLVFTPSEADARLSRQTTILAADPDGLTERKLAVLIVEPGRVFTTFGAPAPAAQARTLRRRYRVPDASFRVILVGLDGGEKLSLDDPITLDNLYGVIDGMPMRRRELREQRDD